MYLLFNAVEIFHQECFNQLNASLIIDTVYRSNRLKPWELLGLISLSLLLLIVLIQNFNHIPIEVVY